MPTVTRTLLLFLALGAAATWADDTGFGSIKKIDLSDDKPAAPNHTVIMMNLKRVAPGRLGQVILYQFPKRARIDFEADGLPKGEYVFAVAPKCSKGGYGKAWTDLYRFQTLSGHIQNEKSLPQAGLREGKKGTLILMGKALALFRIKPLQLIDCKTIEQSQL